MFSTVETSAKCNVNVDAAFLELATILKHQYDQGGHQEYSRLAFGIYGHHVFTFSGDTFRLGAGGSTPIGNQWQQCCRW